MPKGPGTIARKEEIVNACGELYQKMSFKEITLKEIASATTFTRTSIYNYFETKEEIFLSLMEREYRLWIHELNILCDSHEAMSVEVFAGEVARTLEHRPMLLKLLSMNHFDMELNSRQANLRDFKAAYGESINAMRRCLVKFFPQMDEAALRRFLYAFFPFLYGIYPYTVVSDKQRSAMEEAGVDFVYMNVYDIAFNCVKSLLSR